MGGETLRNHPRSVVDCGTALSGPGGIELILPKLGVTIGMLCRTFGRAAMWLGVPSAIMESTVGVISLHLKQESKYESRD